MRVTPTGMLGGPLRPVALAAAGYTAALLLGRVATTAMDNGDSFQGLGIAALTLVVFAPLAALIGAVIGHAPYRRIRLAGEDRMRFLLAFTTAAAASAAGFVWADIATGTVSALLGATALLILRAALIERSRLS